MPDPISASEDGMGGITASPAAAARIRELYAEKLRAEQERDELADKRFAGVLRQVEERAERAEEERDLLRDALESYADEGNYTILAAPSFDSSRDPNGSLRPIMDRGGLARAVLGRLDG